LNFKVFSEENFKKVKKKLKKKYQYIIEEYLDGNLYSVDFFCNGEDIFLLNFTREISCLEMINSFSDDFVEKYKDQLEENVYKRAKHVVSENARVIASKKALAADEMERFGDLMYASHKSLSEDYEVSCKELDILVNLAAEEEIEGARMTGAGFGGCTVNLVKKSKVDDFVTNIKERYKAETGIEAEVYVSNPGDGARKW
jgi:galactokinase